jgi:adenylyltransferase/sulfurtransferase
VIKIERRDSTPSPFARQTLIPGWDQDRVTATRVLIAGVGALGNACATDLALTGFRNFLLADFDMIDTSNLSRTILFRRGDEGRSKVAVATERLREIALSENPLVIGLDGDVVWDFGWGVYRRVDLVFGCVDSSEARAAVGLPGTAFRVPTIVGGIHGYDGSVIVQGGPSGACIACSFGREEWANIRQRYSCDQVRRVLAEEARFPTTQISSAVTSALMVQEGLKIIHGDSAATGSRIFYAGRRPVIERFSIRRSPRCPFHLDAGVVMEIPELSNTIAAGAAVEIVSRRLGGAATLDLGRDFVVTCRCKGCGEELSLGRPLHRVFEGDLVCSACSAADRAPEGDPQIRRISQISENSEASILDLSLKELGLPPLHVLEARLSAGSRWVELTGDLASVLPRWPEGVSETR